MPNPILNLFDGDAFGIVSLTAKVQNVPFTPHLLGDMGLFFAQGSETTDIAVEIENGTLTVIPTSPRGAPPSQSVNTKRKIKKAETAHIAREAAIYADQVQNVRAFGANQLQTLEGLVMNRVEGPFGLRAQIELTHEHHRMGAIDGAVLDADGTTVLWDWFTFFGDTRPDTVDVDFASFTAADALFEQQSTGLVRTITKELNGLVTTSMTPVALCGDNFFDKVYGNKEVKAARKDRDRRERDPKDDVFGKSKAFTRLTYGGITYANYRGTDDGVVSVPTNEARLFPAGVPGLFQVHYAPADTWDAANTPGLPVYLLQRRERQTESARVFEMQSNPLHLCIKPKALRRLEIKAS